MLQDVAYLLGLPIVGEAVGPRVVAALWKDDLEARFALVDRVEEAGPINPHPRAAGPLKTWFLQFTVRIDSIFKFNCYNSHVPLSVETINLNCLCSLPCWLRMRRVQCDQIAGGMPNLVVWLHHVQQDSWQLGR